MEGGCSTFTSLITHCKSPSVQSNAKKESESTAELVRRAIELGTTSTVNYVADYDASKSSVNVFKSPKFEDRSFIAHAR